MKHFLFITFTTTTLLFVNSHLKAQIQKQFFYYSIHLTSAEPCSLDATNKNIYQPYPMPSGVSQVSFKYTLQNSIATIQGKITAQLNGIDVLFPTSNIVSEVPPNSNLSGEFTAYGLAPGTYKLYIAYVTKSTVGHYVSAGRLIFADSVVADEQYDYIVQQSIIDSDRDDIDDNVEQQLLETFRPYYKFSKHDGSEEAYRPTDVLWYIRNSELLATDNEDASAIRSNTLLVNRPDAVIFNNTSPDGPTPYLASDLQINPVSTPYHINPLNNLLGRNGAEWSTVLEYKNIGLYGHVVPIRLIKNTDGTLVYNCSVKPSLNDPGDVYYKIEYWQFFGFNECHCGDIGIHEGDWITIQLLYNPTTAKIETVLYYEHGKLEIRFDMLLAKGPFAVTYPNTTENFAEFQGAHYGNDCYADAKEINGDGVNDACSNNAIRFCADPVTQQFTHPVVYIENGSHEPWPLWTGFFAAVPNHNGDDEAHCYLTATPPNLGEVEFPMTSTPGAYEILHFNGRWGAKNDGAKGPTTHMQWTWPYNSQLGLLLNNSEKDY
jgi:hypothetical protein